MEGRQITQAHAPFRDYASKKGSALTLNFFSNPSDFLLVKNKLTSRCRLCVKGRNGDKLQTVRDNFYKNHEPIVIHSKI